MKIIECYIQNFGKISDKRFEFNDGFNTVLAENGYGKTTLSVFIKCMLFGMNDTRKMSLDENERKRYLPWSGAACSGSLTFTSKNKTYRIERSFAPKAADDSFKLFDLDLGRESTDFSALLGEELLGIDADGFERTLFLSEKNLSPKNDNPTVSAKLSELVGCDGDISKMDDALKLLDEQRKAYAKKGGSGEIAEIRAEISRLEYELSQVEQCEERMKAAEEELAALSVRERELAEEDREIIREREALARKSGDMTYKATISNMRARLAANEARRDELIGFFNGNPPTLASIDKAKASEAEAKNLHAKIGEGESEEYLNLKGYFDTKASPEHIEEIKLVYDRAKNGNYKNLELARKKKLCFDKRTPSVEEIDSIIDMFKENATKGAPFCFAAAGIVAVIGILLGILVNPISLLLLLPAVAFAFLPSFAKKKRIEKRLRAANDFFFSVSSFLAQSAKAPLIILKELRELVLDDSLDDEKLAQSDEAELRRFTSMFGKDGYLYSDVAEILKNHERFKELSAIENYKAQNRLSALASLKRLEEEISDFVSLYQCKSDDPIEEIRAALVEYTRISEDIINNRCDLTSLSANLAETEQTNTTRSSAELDKRSSELSELISEVNRKRALLERQYRADAERADSREELISAKREQEERLERYTENLEIIKLTKKHLEAAKDAMTSKYLGKTKQSFTKYAEIISGAAGSYEMDTSFSVSKTEGAKTHAIEAYSRGMRDLYNIAARFALIDSLYENDTPFVIFDDPFLAFDDEKCASALEILKKLSEERQIIYFTCSKSRT